MRISDGDCRMLISELRYKGYSHNTIESILISFEIDQNKISKLIDDVDSLIKDCLELYGVFHFQGLGVNPTIRSHVNKSTGVLL